VKVAVHLTATLRAYLPPGARGDSVVLDVAEGTTVEPGITLYAGPVFDEQPSIAMRIDLLEMDWYPRWDIVEWAFDPDDSLATWSGKVPLADGSFVIESDRLQATVAISVAKLY